MINLDKYNSATNYKIYLVNKGAVARNFWCFLQKPEVTPSDQIYGNSSTMLSVTPDYAGDNTFTIPVQYKLGAGASNRAVGLNVKIDSSIIKDVQLEQVWEASYATVPPPQGPQLSMVQGESSPPKTVAIQSNTFNRVKNENDGWFSNMSFGIETANGFVGLTWSPEPNVKSTITPKFAFYIATGNYTSNDLVDIASISRDAEKVELTDFKNLAVTVTLTKEGKWKKVPGKPSD